MKQPDLGKKLLKLRKSKGLTQVELVEKCNITVRTLQRIESGEVTPRSHTVRVIFTALDYDFYNLLEGELKEEVKVEVESISISNRLKRIYKYIFELFNLKTNTMKKLSILTVSIILTFVMFFGFNYDAIAQRRLQKKMVGTWQICNPDGTFKAAYGNENMMRYKIITKESFIVLDLMNKYDNKKVLNNFAGTISAKNNIYTEFIEHATSGYSHYIGIRNSFTVEIKKDLMILKGVDNDIDEIWRKIKD